MPFNATLIVLAAAGLINAGFLTYKHYQKKPLVCPINHDCNAVVESKWGNMLGVRNEILGVLFYGGMLTLGIGNILLPTYLNQIKLFILIGGSAGLLFSIILTLIQKYAIKDFCFYCLISAGISLLLFLNSLVVYNG